MVELSYEERFRVRFQDKVDPIKDCDAWVACRNKDGYGRIGYRGGEVRAHHAAWYLTYHYWAKYLLHSCDHPGCVNVSHLREGTHQDNMRDRDAKGRQAKGDRSGSRTYPERRAYGERHGKVKLSDLQVEEILALKVLMSHRKIASVYGVSYSQIGKILRKEQRRGYT